MTEESRIVCGKDLRKYLFVIGAFAAMILVGSYWYTAYYDRKEGLASLSAVGPDLAVTGGPAAAPVGTPVAAAPMTVGASPFRAVAAALKPGIVNISATRGGATPPAQQTAVPQGGVGFSDPFTGVGIQSIGSGIVVTSDGYVLTNYHVVEKATEIYVTTFLPEGGTNRSFAEVVRLSERLDLALLKIEPTGTLYPAALGDSDRVQVGDPVIAIGSPFGLDQTVSQGIVSGKRKSIVIEGVNHNNLIQSDAAINQGNSGGALVDANGYVIGVNTAIYTPTGAFAGVGFAVPSNDARDFVDEVVPVPAITPDLKGAMKRQATAVPAAAAAGAPPPIAANAAVPGNHQADGRAAMPCATCHQIAGGAPMGGQGLPAAQFATSPGGAVGMNAAVMPAPQGMAPGQPTQGTGTATWMGADVRPLDQATARQVQSPVIDGAFVNTVAPGSPAEAAGLQPGDIVFKLEGRWILGPDHLREVVAGYGQGETLRVSVYRNGARQDLYLTVGNPVNAFAPTAPPVAPLATLPAPGTANTPPAVPTEFEWLGMELDPITAAVAAKDPALTGKQGAVVADVTPNSVGANAGLMVNDVLLSIGGLPVGTPEGLDAAIKQAGTAPGTVVYLERGGQIFTTTLVQ
ncbi:MAG: trypsin-like peptidase domain-containing protein [Nitrospinae bacterium]|nr:trypsin-like peptidase domain-containing protein [Nitrospinota bacterium]